MKNYNFFFFLTNYILNVIITIRKEGVFMKREELWKYKYNLAKQYYIEHGNLFMPEHYQINDIKLGVWIVSQRRLLKIENPTKSDKEKIALLNEIGMIWDPNAYLWNFHFNLAEKYYLDYGNLNIPIDYEINEIKLGKWIAEQRKAFNGTGTYKITNERIEKLNKIGMIWSLQKKSWYEKYTIAYKFYQKYGHLKVPSKFKMNGVNLGLWILMQRREYKKVNHGSLTDKQIMLLEKIDMIWSVQEKHEWDNYYQECVNYFNQYGNLDIKRNYEINSLKLGIWLNRQRQLYLNNQLEREKIEKLERLNIDWSPRLNNLTNMEITSQNKRNIQIKILLKFRNILKYYDDNTTIDLYKQEEITKQMRKKLGI